MSKTLKNHNSLDAFISYRRDGGASVAAFLHKELVNRGLRVFMDVNELESGDYITAIKNNIKASKSFILLVSESIFASESVLLEIKEAIALNLNIVPIFINNLQAFPNVPSDIADLGNINGIILNHRDFDNTLNEIMTRITSRKDELIFGITESFTVENLDYLLKRVRDFDEAYSFKLLSFTKQYIRELAHDSNVEKSKGIIEDTLKTSLVSDAKEVAKKLGFDHRGSMDRLIQEAQKWIEEGDSYVNNSIIVKDEPDRYEFFSQSLVEFYRSRDRLNYLKELFYSLDMKPSSSRSSYDFITHLMDYSDSIEDIFETLKPSEADIKEIISTMFYPPPKGRLKDLIAYICEWVDYK